MYFLSIRLKSHVRLYRETVIFYGNEMRFYNYSIGKIYQMTSISEFTDNFLSLFL